MADTYPYWPANFIQNPFAIAGRQAADGINRVALDYKIPPANGMTHNINVIPFPSITVMKIDSVAVAGFSPISGRGSGAGLMEMMAASIAATKSRGEVKK